MMNEAVIVSICRTAIGKAPRGTLRYTHSMDLAGMVVKEAIARVPQLDPAEVDAVVFGSSQPESETGYNMGRVAGRLAGLPDSVPGWGVTCFCASGSVSIAAAVDRIRSGFADVIVAGGVETMSQTLFGGIRNAFSPKLVNERPDYWINMGCTAEIVAERYNISREDQDWLGYTSHMRASAAIKNGLFKEEIIPVNVIDRFEGPDHTMQERTIVFDTDEGVRPETTLEGLAKLKPYARLGGSVTPGNSSQTSEGAGAAVVMSAKKAAALGIKPMAIVHGFSLVGVAPDEMGVGPRYAIPKVMEQTGRNIQDMDLFEINEAFASQAIYCVRELGLDFDYVNVNGGAIAQGHPLGCTGILLTAKLLHELGRRKQKYGVVSMCVGTGLGAATVFERL
jgi:acetyl-CoA acyltransferase